MCPVPSAIRESSSVNCITRGTPNVSCTICNKRIIVSHISPEEHQICLQPSAIREPSSVYCITRGTPNVSCTICNKRSIIRFTRLSSLRFLHPGFLFFLKIYQIYNMGLPFIDETWLALTILFTIITLKKNVLC